MGTKENKKKTNFGVLATVFSLIAIVACVAGMYIYTITSALVAVISGVVALCKQGENKVLGIIGIVIGIIAAILALPVFLHDLSIIM